MNWQAWEILVSVMGTLGRSEAETCMIGDRASHLVLASEFPIWLPVTIYSLLYALLFLNRSLCSLTRLEAT